jgi:hypothetical protein
MNDLLQYSRSIKGDFEKIKILQSSFTGEERIAPQNLIKNPAK